MTLTGTVEAYRGRVTQARQAIKAVVQDAGSPDQAIEQVFRWVQVEVAAGNRTGAWQAVRVLDQLTREKRKALKEEAAHAIHRSYAD